MEWRLVARLGLLSILGLARCQCNESLGAANIDMPQIDVCVSPSPGAPEVCYEAEKQARQAELCAGGGECLRPTLTADIGRILAGNTGTLNIKVTNVGNADLTLFNPSGSALGYSLNPPQRPGSTPYKVLVPGEIFTFELRRSGNTCGGRDITLLVNSNDAEKPSGAPQTFDPGAADSPVTINVTSLVGGPCLCALPPTSLDFGHIGIGSSRVMRFTFESCGDQALSWSNAQITNSSSGVFTCTTGSACDSAIPATPTTLQPGDRGSIDVRYTPGFAIPSLGEAGIYTDAAAYQPYYPVTLSGTGDTPPSCKLTAVPDTTSFGTVTTGNSQPRTFRIQNTGELTCRLFGLQRTAGSADFFISSGAVPPQVTLLPGNSHTLEITYQPNDDQPDTATFTANADDTNATAATADIVVSGNPTLPPSGCVLSVQPDSLDFGDVNVGDSVSMTVNFTNVTNGNDICRLNSASLASGAPDFRLGSLSATFPCNFLDPTGPQCLFPGAGGSVTVTFEPQTEGAKNGLLHVDSNDVTTPGGDYDIPLYGNGMGSRICVDVSGATPATNQCPPTQPCDTVNFGSTTTPANRNITITNCGAGSLTIRGLLMDPAGGLAFARLAPTAAQIPMTLTAGSSTTLTIRYVPSNSGADLGGIDIMSNASNTQDARLALQGNYSGGCTVECQPAVLQFGSVEVGTSDTRSIICSNMGASQVSINNVTYSGDPALSLVSGTYAQLQPGDSFPVQIKCAPQSTGQKAGNTNIAVSCGPIGVNIECNAIDPPLPQCIGSQTFAPIAKWSWTGQGSAPEYKDVWVTPVVINLDDDNSDGHVDVLDIPDVIFTAFDSKPPNFSGTSLTGVNDPEPGQVVAVDGRTGAVKWVWGRLPATKDDPLAMCAQAEASLAAADIDADGLPEIIVVKYTWIPPNQCEDTDFQCQVRGRYVFGSLVALESDGSFKWESEHWHQSEDIGEDASAPTIGDIDGDGLPEIAYGNAVFDHNGMLKFEGAITEGEGNPGWGTCVIFADLTGDGVSELIAGRTAYRADGSKVFDRSDLYDANTAIANVDSDPQPEIVALTGGDDLYILETDGTTKYGPVHIDSGNVDNNGNSQGFIPTNPAVGDVDGDGKPEIIIAATNFIHVYEHDLTPKWTMPISDQTGASGPTTFDFEGDGRSEVVHADENDVWVFNGPNGAVKYDAERSSRTIVDNPVIADVDNDGHADILVVNESIGGGAHGVTLYNNDKNNWVGTRRVWNQHAYHVTNISESGIVPAFEYSTQPPYDWTRNNVYRSNTVRCE